MLRFPALFLELLFLDVVSLYYSAAAHILNGCSVANMRVELWKDM